MRRKPDSVQGFTSINIFHLHRVQMTQWFIPSFYTQLILIIRVQDGSFEYIADRIKRKNFAGDMIATIAIPVIKLYQYMNQRNI